MNKKISIVILSLFVFNIPSFNFVIAQVPTVPTPVCESVPGIPCPGDKNIDISKLQKAQTAPVLSSKLNNSKTLEDLMANMNKLIADLNDKIENIAGKIGQFFDGLFKQKTNSKK